MNTNPTYQQELLRKYIDGSITIDQRHELEKLALDDPFLFDALEGIHADKERSITELKEIQEKIGSSQSEKSAKQRRLVPWQWMSIAAGILLVMAIGFLIRPEEDLQWGKATAESASRLPSMDKYADYTDASEEASSEVQIADNRSTQSTPLNNIDSVIRYNKTELIDDKSIIISDGNKDVKKLESNANKKILTQKEIRTLPTKTIDEIAATSSGLNTTTKDSSISIRGSRGDATNVYVDGIRVSESSIPPTAGQSSEVSQKNKAKNEGSDDFDNLENMPPNAVFSKKESSKRKAQQPDPSSENDSDIKMENSSVVTKITGLVTDESGLPLIGATVMDETSNAGTMTDIDGKFTLDISNNAQMIKVSYTGFANKIIALDGSPTYEIIMEEGALLDEVAVMQNSGVKVSKSRLLQARPYEGFEAFTSYLEDNMILPDGCNGGAVTLSFTINTDGNLENIKVENASNTTCSSEALRLLKNGGKWVTTPPRQTVATEYIMKMSY